MSIWNRQRSNRFSKSILPLERINRLFLILLTSVGTLCLSFAQERYTVNRPTQSYKTYEKEESSPRVETILWETDYENARKTAESSVRQLLIYFYADQDTPNTDEKIEETIVRQGKTTVRQPNSVSQSITSACQEFDAVVLDDSFVRSSLDRYVLLKLPMDAKTIGDDGTETLILSQPDFKHMAGYPGLVVMDFEHQDTPYYGQVTGILPFWRTECPTAEQAAIFLELPPGTLTQRTLTYAVRIHPDKPLSSEGEPIAPVVQVATDHAKYQADRGVIGHHNFGERSRKVIDLLGSGSPSEICAQSWSDKSMFEGALNCMRAWRNSSGHWSIARKNHRYYGYDMTEGKNGTWYAVGFFLD